MLEFVLGALVVCFRVVVLVTCLGVEVVLVGGVGNLACGKKWPCVP